MESLETELHRARELSVDELADAIESIGFECTRCGACCKADEPVEGGATERASDEERQSDGSIADESGDPHTATVFPEEVREMQAAAEDAFEESYDWRDVARPIPYGLDGGEDGATGETFEWAIQTDACGDCTFYDEDADGTGACTVHQDRPLVCRTYPFSVALGGTSEPMGEAVDRDGLVRAHECEGLGRDISRADAEDLAAALKERAVRDIEEAIELRERYEPRPDAGGVVVHDSEGAKRPDGTPLEDN